MSKRRNRKRPASSQEPAQEAAPEKRQNNNSRPRRDSRQNSRKDKGVKYDHAPTYVYLVKNQKTSETYLCGFEERLEAGTAVITPTRYGLDMGTNLGYLRSKMLSSTVAELEAAGEESAFIEEGRGCEGCSNCDGQPEGQPEAPQEEDAIEEERKALFEKALEQEKADRDKALKSLDRIERVADDHDLMRHAENLEKSRQAMTICKDKIRQHNLDMKLVDAHYLLCESKVLFFFTAENRVDFRELVKDLVSVFRMRIELRQIGVRDESRVLGGLGVCGRDYCCHGVSDHLRPVSIKMAKEQNLSLNSMKISGPCGRLLCCLAYEYDFYKEVKSKLPSVGNRLKIRNELLKISEVNILSRNYHLTAMDGRMLTIPFDKVTYDKESGRWDVDKDYIEEVLSV